MAQNEGGYSPLTTASIPRISVRDVDDLYPDYQATLTSGGGAEPGVYEKRDTGSTPRLGEEVPKTTSDMNKLYTWKPGDIVRGAHAKNNIQMKEYIKDMTKAAGEGAYKHIFVDTFAPIGPQTEKFKKKGSSRKSNKRKTNSTI